MSKYVLFIQGGGDGGYEADQALVASLQESLGKEYDVHYPELKSDEAASDFGWLEQIGEEIAKINSEGMVVGHSLGASMLLKYLSENPGSTNLKGVFLIATPFWEGAEEWKRGLKLQEDFANKLPEQVPLFFYHSQDDEEVPFSHLDLYRQKLPTATFRVLKKGGHQLNNDLTVVANDIKSL